MSSLAERLIINWYQPRNSFLRGCPLISMSGAEMMIWSRVGKSRWWWGQNPVSCGTFSIWETIFNTFHIHACVSFLFLCEDVPPAVEQPLTMSCSPTVGYFHSSQLPPPLAVSCSPSSHPGNIGTLGHDWANIRLRKWANNGILILAHHWFDRWPRSRQPSNGPLSEFQCWTYIPNEYLPSL